ncbi:MAG: protein phosphatase 2C domain-containing protein [Pseudonocardiaceae bacterium]
MNFRRFRAGPAPAGDQARPAELEPPAKPVITTPLDPPPRERWAPVVLDQPVTSFEPRPVYCPPYWPDTIVDGWSTTHFTVRLASVRGYAHRCYGKPRQDDAVVAVHDPTGSLVFAVADGVSAAEQAQLGAQLACRSAVDGMLAALDADQRGPDWSGLVTSIAQRLVDRAQPRHGAPDGDSARAEELFATTLVAGLARPTATGSVAEPHPSRRLGGVVTGPRALLRGAETEVRSRRPSRLLGRLSAASAAHADRAGHRATGTGDGAARRH